MSGWKLWSYESLWNLIFSLWSLEAHDISQHLFIWFCRCWSLINNFFLFSPITAAESWNTDSFLFIWLYCCCWLRLFFIKITESRTKFAWFKTVFVCIYFYDILTQSLIVWGRFVLLIHWRCHTQLVVIAAVRWIITVLSLKFHV